MSEDYSSDYTEENKTQSDEYGPGAYELIPGDVEQNEWVFQRLVWDFSGMQSDQSSPVFVAYKMVNLGTNGGRPILRAVRCTLTALRAIFEMMVAPTQKQIWNAYAAWGEEQGLDSDTAQKLSIYTYEGHPRDDPNNSALSPDNGNPTVFWGITHIALINANLDGRSLRLSAFESLFRDYMKPEKKQRFKGNFMNYKYMTDEVARSSSRVAMYWKTLTDKSFLRDELQIPWFCETKLLSEGANGEEPVLDEVFATPCILHALKDSVDEDTLTKLRNGKIIFGVGVKTNEFRDILKKAGYEVIIYRVQYKSPNEKRFSVNNNKSDHFDPNLKQIKLMYWEEHWMKYKEVKYRCKNGLKNVCFLRILEESKNEGLIKPYSAYEYAKIYNNYSFDKLIKFDDKRFFETHENNYEFGDDDLEVPEFKEHREAQHIFFADFECTTDDKYHRPFMCCMKEILVWHNGNNLQYLRGEKDYTFTGEDCGFEMLKTILNLYPLSDDKKNIYSEKTLPTCRVYFYNLHYDFTFLMKYLKRVKMINKGNNLYSATGIFQIGGKSTKIDFWDALPIFRCTLRQAALSYLNEEQKKSIKKEVFPYELYTYSFFEKYYDGWCPIEEFTNAFKTDQLKQDFKNTLKDLEEDEVLEIEEAGRMHYKLGERVRYSDLINGDKINYRKYAEFYCLQDVRCLQEIMINFASLLEGRSVEGINGRIPFNINLWKFRTASSIGYEYFLRTVMFKQEQCGKWSRTHDWFVPKAALRNIIQKTIRGGRVMVRDNQKQHYKSSDNENIRIQDYDGVSLYPSAMSVLWITEGKPSLIKGDFDHNYFLENFTHPDAPINEFKRFNDGCVHVTWLNTKKPRHFPLLCTKDPKTKLNNYRNFNSEEVDIWVNAIDLFNLCEFQDAEFKFDSAVVWTGKRYYEIRDSIKELFNFRLANKSHQIQIVAKLNMNSIFGKSILKPCDKVKEIVDKRGYQKDPTSRNGWKEVDRWTEYFDRNSYRINSFEILEGDKILVEIFKRDVSPSFNIFGSNVLAMARRIIGRVMALAEDLEEEYPIMSPGLFYTDTDSFEIREDLLGLLEKRFVDKYGKELKGKNLCQFHTDFDIPSSFKEGEFVVGAEESWFIMKKMYACKLIGSQGSVGYHLRMKGIPTDLVKYEDYEKLFNGESVKFNMLDGHTSFFYENGKVGSRREMTREVMTVETRKRKREEMLGDRELFQNLKEFLELNTPSI